MPKASSNPKTLTQPGSPYWREVIATMWQRSERDDPIIDGLRGISILMIILFHSFYGAMYVLRKPDLIREFLGRFPPELSFVATADKAVDIFFVVSAYLLGSSLFKMHERGQKIKTIEFYLKRLARIYPLFLLAIILYFPINVKQSWNNLIYNLFFIDNFVYSCIIPVGWSLSIEMQFYLILPAISRLLYKQNPKFRMILLWAMYLASFIIGLAVCLIYPIIYQTKIFNFHPDLVDPTLLMDRLYYPTHTRYGPLILGLIWALVSVNPEYRDRVRRFFASSHLRYNISILFGILLMWAMSFFPVYQPDSLFYQYFSPTLNLILHISHRNLYCLGLICILIPLTIMAPPTGLGRLIQSLLSLRIWRPFAQTVFPIYLFHFPMIGLAGLITFATTNIKTITTVSMPQVLMIFCLASFFSLILGTLLHILIEVPLIRRGYTWAESLSVKVPKHQ